MNSVLIVSCNTDLKINQGIIIQERIGNGLETSEDIKWSESECDLKVHHTEYTDTLDLAFAKKNDTKVFGLSP